ncbi:MAG: Gfo/Idh/MocA family oxidoreductase, partial [Acidobacteriota bacterium]
MAEALRVGVVGVGHLGQHHARLYAALPAAHLVGIVDRDRDRATEIAARHDCRVFASVDALLGEVDAVSVAVPTAAHLAVAGPALENGLACLVEKPLAPDVAAARRLVDLAARHASTLMVGHTERFNPALAAARPHVKRPGFIEAQRLASFTPRSLDVDVVLDVMIHDIDAVLDLVGERPVSVDAVGVSALTDKVDLANARLRFPGGCAANLTASRMSLGRVRKLRIFQPDAYINIDCAAREAMRYSLLPGSGDRPEIRGKMLGVVDAEPLALELAEFIDATRQRRTPRCSGEEGLAALATAVEVVEQMNRVDA